MKIIVLLLVAIAVFGAVLLAAENAEAFVNCTRWCNGNCCTARCCDEYGNCSTCTQCCIGNYCTTTCT